MRLTKFWSTGLNGYLDFDLDLSRDLSFLIGINGSGKTTVLRGIMALLGPDIGWLTNTKFATIGISFTHEGSSHNISATKKSGSILLIAKIFDEVIEHDLSESEIVHLTRLEEEFAYDSEGSRIILRESKLSIPDKVTIFRIIKNLPSPIFLGLDRSTLPISDQRPSAKHRGRSSLGGHATLRSFLDESVSQAEQIAVRAGRSAVIERTRRAAILREKVLLSLFSDVSINRMGTLPKTQDIKKIESTRRSLKQAFVKLGINSETLSSNIDPFFTKVIECASRLTKYNDVNEIFRDNNDELFYNWLDITPRLQLMSQVEHLVKDFNAEERDIFERSRRYEEILNSFLHDSHKNIYFNDEGNLKISVPSNDEADVFYLSSGERQLFVLITSLMFNDDSKQADVLIIDEPELSLHLKWQVMFVDSLQQANKDIQIILATHSPSIINHRVEDCVDLA